MKLHFHGRDYEDPYLEWQVSEGEIGGKYRGTAWKLHRLKEPHYIPAHHDELVYRGIHYIK
ncbi:DUF4278 domain-containing protein [Myxosarcina sp. GI1]|uniref:DUF4278 domain-containing protein n=1 Tax=Myxosarcina sp. GI1 TaxID=1541065 RepID=UPI00056D4FB9|nr:DUF4278 domain-containing protein [Myxosarcina sp. GI1]